MKAKPFRHEVEPRFAKVSGLIGKIGDQSQLMWRQKSANWPSRPITSPFRMLTAT
jgi:hypothetical protein